MVVFLSLPIRGEGVSEEVTTEDTSVENVAETASVEEGAAVAGLNLLDERYKWYVVQAYSGYEESAKRALVEKINSQSLQDRVGDIVVPKTTTFKTLKSGKKKRVDKTSFPGYILLQADLNDAIVGCVTSTPRVTGFVGNPKNPSPMSDREVIRLLNPDAAPEEEVQVSGLEFRLGEKVKVADGPFTNFEGSVEEVKADKQKLRVLVSIFGRETPVELSYNQVEKI